MKPLVLDDSIPYCVLHGWQWWPNDLSGDLDMAIAPQHLSALERSLQAQDEGRPVQLLQHEASGFYFVLACEGEQGIDFMLVDAATDYRRDGRVFFTANELLTGRCRQNGLWVASPQVEFGYLLVKKVLKGAIATHQQQRLWALMQELNEGARAMTKRLFGPKLGDCVLEWIATQSWTALEHHVPRLQRALLWQALWRDPLNLLRYWIPEGARMWRRWRYPTGLFIAVLGPDGAGKSALIERLRADLAGAFRRSAVFHLQPDILRQKEDEGPVTAPHAKPLHPLWLSLLKIPYYLLDYGLGYTLRVRPQLVRSTLVLFDRYYDDVLVDSRRYRYGGPSWLVHWLQRAIPRPDLFLILDAPAEQLLQRKQELPGPELQRQRVGYHRLATGYQNAYVLNTSAPVAEVARQASAVILDFLHERYLQRRHLWLGKTSRQASTCQAALAPLLNLDEGRCLRGSEPDPGGPHEVLETAVPFGLVALGDGRGYLVPLQSRRAAAAALRLYNPQTLQARIGRRLLVVGLRLGVGQPFLKRTWLPMRRMAGQQQAHHVPLLAYLQDLLGQGHLTFAISLGTPGPHRKPVVQMMDTQGRILGYAKVGQDETSNALVQNEARVLQALATAHWQAFSLPEVLATAWWRDHFLCVLSAPKSPGGRVPQRLTPLHLEALNELWAMQAVWMPLPLSAFWMTVAQHARQVHHAYYRGVLEHGMAMAEEWLATISLPFRFCHGDFTPWNLQRDGKKLFIVDWECASAIGSPMWDLFHFIFQTLYLVKKWDAARICRVLVDHGPLQQPIASALRNVGLAAMPPKAFMLLYCVERLAFWALTAPRHRALLRTLSAMVNFLTLAL